MPADRHFTRLDTSEMKSHIERKLGQAKTEMYFNLLTRYLNLKISKPEFDKLCIGTIGRENVRLHNNLLRSIIKNACLAKTPPPKETKVEGPLGVKAGNGYQRSCLQSLCKDISSSSRKGMTSGIRDSKLKDRPSPLGPHGKSHSVVCEDSVPKIQDQQQQSATELLSLGSRPPGSVEEGEEVDQAADSPIICSWSLVKSPLGIPTNTEVTPKARRNSSASYAEACHKRGELPDTNSLRKRLERKLEVEGLKVSVDCANLLNNGLDVFMKRLIKPCLHLAESRSVHKDTDPRPRCFSASKLDFQVAVELNPRILGNDWPSQLEIFACLRQNLDDIDLELLKS
ncbi:Transcriptional coactivator Hfi1/Transcriptional adapter 1 [Melia azedarach]|uniref:Transcriptional coactivator Hfi1/Transcriptional adapter 1 n=1 Tax=Melia azedarach TaxID=155640 RepID=A0ACC1XV04_MELAZ|nr:Transcriptional coactivator Hfi1/Transcriptional adapter 1 [Melia azedarach]